MRLDARATVALAALIACASVAPAAAAARVRSTGAARAVSVGPPPAWVEALEPDTGAAQADEASGGVYYLLSDRQARVQGRSLASYEHYAQRVVTDAGLDSVSQVSISFDPQYQRLRVHAVRVWRDGAWSNRLAAAKIDVIQREPELELQILDGRQSAVLFVDDIRVGDVLDYAFTIEGANPVFDGRYFDSFMVEWSVPLERLRTRLLWPRGRPLYIRNHKTPLAPARRERGDTLELVWEKRAVEALPSESGVPSSYQSYAWIQLSELESWEQVVDWGARLFRVPERLPPEVEARLQAWRQESEDPARRVVAAARFVQDAIRYVGLEMGTASHRPAPPATVVARRFGDCKDKALLLVALLRRLGVDAAPALVSTASGRALDEWQPSPLAFNHAVVRLTLGGAEHWIDATLSGQGGTLGSIHFPNYERALVLEPGESALATLPAKRPPRPSTVTKDAFVLEDVDGPVAYTVETRHEGADADSTRRYFQGRTREEVARSYLKYYSQAFPSIRQTAALEVDDERESNLVVTREHYEILHFSALPRDAGRIETELAAASIDDVLGQPGSPRRLRPLALRYPLWVKHVTEVVLPDARDLPGDVASVATNALRFRYRAWPAQSHLTLEYEYETLTGAVAAVDVSKHIAALDQVRDHLRYTLRWPAPPRAAAGKRINWTLASALGGFVPLLALATLKAFRYRPRAAAPGFAAVLDPRLAGARGGVLGVALVLLQFTALVAGEAREWLGLCFTSEWDELTTAGAARYHVLWEPLLVLQVLGNLLVVAALALAWAFFFGKRRGFAWSLVALGGAWAAAYLTVSALGQQIPGRNPDAALVLGWAVYGLLPLTVAAAYSMLSQRARATFVS